MRTRTRFWLLLVATAAALLLVNALHLPPIVADLARRHGPAPLLDMRPGGYRPGDVAALLALLGAEGRRRYLELLWTVDLVMPALFSAFLWTALSLGGLRRWRGVGPLGGAADYLENGAITLLLTAPATPPALIRAASALTSAKWALYLCAAAAAATGATIRRDRSSRCGRGAPPRPGGGPARSPPPAGTRTAGA